MTCRDAAAWVHDQVDADEGLPPEKRRALATHLRECRDCARVLKEAGCLRLLLRQLPRERMPDHMKDRLLNEFRRSRALSPSAESARQPDSSPQSQQHASHADAAKPPHTDL